MPSQKSESERAARSEEPEQLFRRYYLPVVTFFTRRGFSEEESRDLAQETFLRVYRNMDSFRGESSVETWLFQLAHNLYKNTLRSLQTQKRDAQEVSLSAAEGGAALAAEEDRDSLRIILSDERERLLREALLDLPPQMRRCVTLRVEHNLKYREIAQLMGVSIETVKAHLYQARQHLRDKLADHFTDREF